MRSGSVPDDIFTSIEDSGGRDTVGVPVHCSSVRSGDLVPALRPPSRILVLCLNLLWLFSQDDQLFAQLEL